MNAPAPPASRPRPLWPLFLLSAPGLVWVAAFSPDPVVLATLPGVFVMLWMGDRLARWKHVVVFLFLFCSLAIGYGYRWLAQTTQDFGGVPEPLSWVLVALFGFVGSIHILVFAILYRSLKSRGRRPGPLLVVLFWVAAENLPIRFFPWMAGHGAVNAPPLVQSAEWGGVPAVSFALLCLVVPIYEWSQWAFARDPQAKPRAALLTFAIGLALFGWGQWRYGEVRRAEIDATERIKVGIVQANVGSQDKRQAEQRRIDKHRRALRAYEKWSRAAIQGDPDLVLWAETAVTEAIPLALPSHDALRTNGAMAAHGYGFLDELGRERAFLVGAYEKIPGRPRSVTGKPFDERYNVAALRRPGGRDATWAVYRKKFLIPFGEYMPVGPASMLPQEFTMRSWTEPQEPITLEHGGRTLRLVPFLCYEGILPGHVREVARGETRPDLLVSLTNDSWFGDTWEPHQHLNFTRFRAVEHRLPLARATNTGISAFVSASGDVEARLGYDLAGALVRDVPLVTRGPTLYVRGGYLFPWIVTALALLGWLWALFRAPSAAESA